MRWLLRPEEVVDLRPGARGELVTLLRGGKPGVSPRTVALPASVQLGGAVLTGEPVATAYHWRPVQVREHEQASDAAYSVGTFVHTLCMPMRLNRSADSVSYLLRPEPGNFTSQGSLWGYLVGGSFVVCSGIVVGVCPREHDPGRGRNMRIARLPAELRPQHPLQFPALSREAYDTGGGTTYRSHLVTLVVTPDGWITGVSDREGKGAVDLSAVRFSIGRGISLMDEVSLHTVDVGGSRLVTLQGVLSEKFFTAQGGKSLALLPESCRPPREMHFIVSGTSGGFHLLLVQPLHGCGVGGELTWRDSTWNHDTVHLTGVMYEVGAEAMHCATLDSSWTGEALEVFVKDFQQFLIRKYGSIKAAWEQVFDLDGSGAINFTEFGNGCKHTGYVGNTTRLWAAFDEDRSGEISIEELSTGMGRKKRQTMKSGLSSVLARQRTLQTPQSSRRSGGSGTLRSITRETTLATILPGMLE